ncbi:TrgA family protein [Rhodalgimonas zhirmunskyi]|uniref:TrgA family protein n=1 Tax=Rhodalgimonas zhirmunskyi TaxID=2964767 RepID=A0AAJ1UBQ5_9RHOB|nr:TrgA family protein [Rhodoalgimonas zhirmunskyi]MDQ2092967.1 TrgA family protein [Rhodoalgimonas zhirmunskyi]
MPTFARVTAAVCLAALAFYVSGMVIETMPEKSNWGDFQLVNAVIGLLVGWFILGSRVGVDYITSIGIGFTGMLALVFWCLFFYAFREMISLSLDRRFDGPVEAVVGVFQIGLEYGAVLVQPMIMLVLLLGGAAAGLISEFVNRRWS